MTASALSSEDFDDPAVCEAIIEQLRMGIPPLRAVDHFTVGRRHELREIDHLLLDSAQVDAVLVRANYGSGKSHLLRVIREKALRSNYLVSLVEVSAANGVRFNRMDQVAAAVFKHIRYPDGDESGVYRLFSEFADSCERSDEYAESRSEITDYESWSRPAGLGSEAMWFMLRGFVLGDDDTRDMALEWLTHNNRRQLSKIEMLEPFTEDLPVWNRVSRFDFLRALQVDANRYEQCWQMLSDVDAIARYSGYSGLIVLFDEFEDVLQNLRNRTYERRAIENLYRFEDGDAGVSAFFSVTPEFTTKATDLMLMKGQFDFNFRKLDRIETFELSPVGLSQFEELAERIVQSHGTAYDWDPVDELGAETIRLKVHDLWDPGNPSRVRLGITGLVAFLDGALEY